MIQLRQFTSICGIGLLLCFSTTLLAQDAQGGRRQRSANGQGNRQRQGNFDPAQFQQRMLERYKERLEITDDSEWKAIGPLIQKVLDVRNAAGSGARSTFGRGVGGTSGGTQPSQTQGQARSALPPSPAAEQLQRAIDSKAPAAEIKAALAKYQQYRKEKLTELEKAQAALRDVLSARQEAIATLSGLL